MCSVRSMSARCLRFPSKRRLRSPAESPIGCDRSYEHSTAPGAWFRRSNDLCSASYRRCSYRVSEQWAILRIITMKMDDRAGRDCGASSELLYRSSLDDLQG